MSVNFLNLPIQISPKIWIKNDCLFARTSFISQILNCFSNSRTVTIDKKRKVIEIKKKTLWFMKSIQTILFEDLKFIDISHREVRSAVSTFPEGYVSDVHNVQIITKNNHIPTTLFKFIVSGGKYTGLGEGRPADLEGLQMKKILQYAKQVSEFTEIPLLEDRDVEVSLKSNHQYECPKCGHKTNTAFFRCMYCGFQETKESLG